MTKRRWIYALNAALLVVLCSFSFSQDGHRANDCVSCHDKVYKKGLSNFFLHNPFRDKQCGRCHLKQEVVAIKTAPVTQRFEQPTFVSRSEYLSEHTILLKGLNSRSTYDISVVFQDSSGNKTREEFKLVPGSVGNVKTDDKRPPEISNVRLGPVVKGIFLETSVMWETDEPSTSCVEYGYSDQYGLHTPEDIVLVRQHRVNIHELEAGKDYQCRVRSRDIFGNEAVSERFVFTTAKVSPASDVEERGAGNGDERSLAVKKSETFVFNSDLGLYYELTKPATMRVEYLEAKDSLSAKEPQVQAATLSEGTHARLRDGKELAIDVCYQCHPPRVLGVSHPVGVSVRETTRIPQDLPTLKGGIITCVTCHDVHGGSRRYFARKKITRDICVSCHEGY